MRLSLSRPLGVSLFVFLSLSTACHKASETKALAPHAVAAQNVTAVAGSVVVPLTGRVSPHKADAPKAGTVSDYLIRVPIPEGAQVALTAGQGVPVTLPLIHHQEARAAVQKIAPNEVTLLLAHQVQELSEQDVRVALPFKGAGLHRIPFTAVYSPRGLDKRVMVLKGDKAEAVEVKVIALAGDREVLVAGALEPDAQVVVEGLDNLLPGDSVRLVQEEGVK